jgi:photosystem II stability/assembly factor-like uncharacterized protein
MIFLIKKRMEKRNFLLFCSVSILFLVLISQAYTQTISPDVYRVLRYRYIGPPGNRTSAVVGVPGDLLVYYIGAASGGIWKSADAGEHWEPIFDDQKVQSIGAIAIAPSDSNVLWAGTGEAFVRSNISIGNGVYKSTDAGKTWKHMGLDKTGRIGRVSIDPRDPDTVFIAAMGHCYGPQKERGVFRTKDGGKTWEHVLFVDENTGCFEVAMDPNNPRILFAGMWPLVIKTWGRESGGPNGGIWKSTDGGESWKRLSGHGLPEPPIGKVGLAIAPSNSDVVYALIETGHPNRGVLWRSDDGGRNWRIASYNRILNERPHYASRVMVNPADENEVYFAANSQSRTLNGGYTTETVPWGGDCHDMWADPKNPDRLMISNDGGAMITLNRGKSWKRVTLPIGQMYHVAVDNQFPYYVYGGRQDGSAYKGPSTGSFSRWGAYNSLWEETAGGECGFVIPDPVDPDIVWGGSYNADFQRANYKTGHINTVHVWPESIYGSHASAVKYRFNWTFPIHISPNDHNRVYAGSQFVHMTNDGGKSWKVISPDLTTNDESKMGPSGGLTRDNLAVEYGCCVFAIAESPIEEGCIWAGSNDGLVHVTRDFGKTWTDVTKNIPNLPEWGTVSNIEPSKHSAGTAYVTIDFHQMNNRDPFVYVTEDYGKTWKSISSDLPKSVFSYVHWINDDPVKKGLLYLGTENSIYISFDNGHHWLSLQNNLPYAPVSHMVVQKDFNDLVVATYGRGFWIMDDISSLQQLNKEVLESDIYFFNPRKAYRLHSRAGGPRVFSRAYIDYYLKEKQNQSVKIEIYDEEGELVNKINGTNHPGINRVMWNMSYYPAESAKLRTKPPGNPHVVEEKRFLELWEKEGWYPILSWGTGGGFRGFLAAPGKYTVKLVLGEKEFVRELDILKDPNSEGSNEGIKEQVNMQKEIRKDLNSVTEMINKIEWMRKQLYDLKTLLKKDKQKDTAIEIEKFDKKLCLVEDELFQPILAEGDSKSFRYPNKLYCKLSVLAGDLNSSVDFAPNKQQREVHAVLKKGLEVQKQLFKKILTDDLPLFNLFLEEKGLSGIIVPEKEAI